MSNSQATGEQARTATGLAFHCHHDVLVEFVYDYAERVTYIREGKPPEERELRLALFRMIPVTLLPLTPQQVEYSKAWAARGKAKAAYDEAEAAYGQAWAEYDEPWAARDKAWAVRDKAWAAYGKAWATTDKAKAAYIRTLDIVALHRTVCHPNCPWDGKTIFAKGTSISVLESS